MIMMVAKGKHHLVVDMLYEYIEVNKIHSHSVDFRACVLDLQTIRQRYGLTERPGLLFGESLSHQVASRCQRLHALKVG